MVKKTYLLILVKKKWHNNVSADHYHMHIYINTYLFLDLQISINSVRVYCLLYCGKLNIYYICLK